jgi:glycosyltransferase involved in cell wall biosynthesis
VRILYVSAEPIRSRQASGTHIDEIVKGLTVAGHEVTTCVTRIVGPYDQTPLARRCAAYLVFWFQALRRLRGTTLVYARAHPANIPIAAAAWLMRIPIVHEINGTYYDVSLTHAWLLPFISIIAALQRFQYRRADALIAVTPQLTNWVREEAPGVLTATIANGANCEIFDPDSPPIKAAVQDYALFFGSLTRWHGVEVMIAAVATDDWPKDLDLVIVGEGQLRPMAQQASSRNSKIQIRASVPQDVLAGYINGAVLGLVPINSAGGRGRFGLSPLKMYEMLACGLPLVVTDFPGQADLVRWLDAGIVIPPDDPVALARAVAALRANPPSRAKMLSVASIIKAEHNWAKRSDEVEKLLTRVVRRCRK